MSEFVMPYPAEFQVLSSRGKNKGKQRVVGTGHTPEGSKPPLLSRRNLLKAAVVAGATIAAGSVVKLEVDRQQYDQEEKSYQGWEAYQNRVLPQFLVLQIGQNIEHTDYPGFNEVGKIIQRSQTDFTSLEQFYPRLQNPIGVGMSNLVQKIGAIADFNESITGVGVNVALKDKKTGAQQNTVLVDPTKVSSSQVLLENSMWLASSMAKRLLLVKEFSHLLYMDQFKQILLDYVTSRFVVTTAAKASLDDLLVTMAYLYGDPAKPSLLGYYFDNGRKFLDYAGYWHIMPAFGLAMERGDLTSQDIGVMYSDKHAFTEAKNRGLLLEPTKGQFQWKQGVGPFSQEWQDVMKPIF